MKKSAILISILALMVFSGCAQISVYDSQSMKGDPVGIKFYYPKAYILVTYTGLEDNPVKTEVVYLPDLYKPRYAKLKPGFGASNLKMSFENGMLTSVGVESDMKLLDTISSFSELLPDVSSKGVGPLPEIPRFELYELKIKKGKVSLKLVEFE